MPKETIRLIMLFAQRASLDIQGIDIFVAAYVSRNRTKGPLFNFVTGKLSQTYRACSGALTSWFARRVGWMEACRSTYPSTSRPQSS